MKPHEIATGPYLVYSDDLERLENIIRAMALVILEWSEATHDSGLHAYNFTMARAALEQALRKQQGDEQ